MEIKLQNLGNSTGIIIPSKFLKSLNIKTNDKVLIEQQDGKIVISKIRKNKISLIQEFEKYKGEDLSTEFEWDGSIGKEILQNKVIK